jgi:F420-dependent methylenetetrahydromethanopterin dehydrogenase
VLAAARELLDPDRYLMLVVGDADKVRDELTATGLGPVEIAAGE